MVDYTITHRNLVEQAAKVFEALISLYSPDIKAKKDWAEITVSEATSQRDGLLERLANPRVLSSARTGILVSSIGHFIDSHWADYQEFPVANPEKRKRVEQLHAELEAITKAVAPINNALEKIEAGRKPG